MNCCNSPALPINRGGFWRLAFRLAGSTSVVGAIFTLKMWPDDDRSGTPVRISDSASNPTRWETEVENNRIWHTLPLSEVDGGTPLLTVGSIYYCTIFATFASETDPQPIARFLAEVQS